MHFICETRLFILVLKPVTTTKSKYINTIQKEQSYHWFVFTIVDLSKRYQVITGKKVDAKTVGINKKKKKIVYKNILPTKSYI